MLAGIALGHDPALAGAHHPGERRAAQIDDELPAAGGNAAIKRQPMQPPAPLPQHQHFVEPGDRLEQRRGDRPRGDRQARAGKALDDMGQQTGRQHGIADAGGGHKQDVHIPDLGALIARAAPLAKQGPALHL